MSRSLIVRPSLREIRIYTTGARRRAILRAVDELETARRTARRHVQRVRRARLMSMLVNPYIFAASGGSSGGADLASIVGAKLWQYQRQGVGQYQDSAATTPAVAHADSLWLWQDDSGNGRDAFNFSGTSGDHPTIDTSISHLGGPTVRSSAGQFLELGDLSALTEADIFVVVQIDADPPGSATDSGLWSLGTSPNATHYCYPDGNIYDDCGSNARKTVGNPTLSLASQFRVYHVRTAANDWAAYLDNSGPNPDIHGDPCLFSTTSNTVAFSNAANLLRSQSPYHILGNVAAFAVCSPVLTSTERGNVFTALTT